MTNPTSNFGWQMPTPTDLVTDLPADFEVFGQAVDTDFADLLGGTTGQILSKTSNTDLDFTWITNDIGDITAVNVTAPITGGGSSGAVTIGVSAASTAAAGVVQLSDSTSTTSSVLASTPTATKAAYDLADTASTTATAAIPKSTVTTAGDVIYATGSSAVTRLGVGSTGQVLTVAAGVPSWATPSAGGKTLTQLASGSMTGSSVSLTGLTQDIFVLRINGAAATNGYLGLQINGITATSSKYQYMNNRHNSNGTQTCQNVTSDDRFYITSTAGSSAINAYITITNSAQAGYHNINFIGSNDNGSVITYTGSAMWVDASAITSLQIIQPSFSAGTYTLWGA